MSVLYAVENKVATITLDRPEMKNALDQAGLDALTAYLAEARGDDGVWLLVIRASGTDFCTGQDVKELSGQAEPGGDFFAPVFRGLKAFHKPVVCAAQGLCLAGGAGIVMGSDVRIITETARMGWPHTKIGICSIGGPSSLARAVPVNIALELMFTGDLLPADRAQALGLVNHVVPESELETTATTIVEKILRNAPLAVRAAKQSTLSTIDLPYDEAVSRAHTILDRLLKTRDAKEGMQAFVEKRPPSWEAR
jgi:enoyl-CoA hydratase/carnithine racemase